MRPAVSVVVPFRDAGRWLPATIDCVRAQAFPGWELLLVDDGSRDGGPAAARRAAARDERIRALSHPERAHRGAFASRLLAARAARAPVLALLDADDLWDRDYLGRHLRFFRRARAAWTYGPARYWFPGRPELGFVHAMPARGEARFAPGELLRNFLSSGYATAPRTTASLLLREAALELAHLEPAARRAPLMEDQFLIWGVAMRRRVAVHPGAWARYRQRSALADRPARYLRDTLRDEERFLAAIRRELARVSPGHPLLAPSGIASRLAELCRRPEGAVAVPSFHERLPAALRAEGPLTGGQTVLH